MKNSLDHPNSRLDFEEEKFSELEATSNRNHSNTIRNTCAFIINKNYITVTADVSTHYLYSSILELILLDLSLTRV